MLGLAYTKEENSGKHFENGECSLVDCMAADRHQTGLEGQLMLFLKILKAVFWYTYLNKCILH